MRQEIVEIREDASRHNGAILRIGEHEYPTEVAHQFDNRHAAELDWYFEEHYRYPFLDEVRASEAAASIRRYGTALFDQLIGNRRASSAYEALKTRAFPGRFFIHVLGSPAFQAIHWEALWDPELPEPFALSVPILRRRAAQAPPLAASPQSSSRLNVLIMCARPRGAGDVAFRTITAPLLEALKNSDVPAQVDLVRPGTWRALVEMLDRVTLDRGPGWYHIIHFDLHGLEFRVSTGFLART